MPSHFLACLVAALLLAGGAAHALQAQTPDSTRADTTRALPADTTRAAPLDSVQTTVRRPAGPPLGFPRSLEGIPAGDSLPARRPFLEATDLLDATPGAFTYRFDVPGAPEGWSPFGLPPHLVALVWEDLSYRSLITGRPRYDLLPLPFLEPLRLGTMPHGVPAGVSASMRPFRPTAPLTELLYWTGAGGLQSIHALHVQQRRRALFGRPGLLTVLGSYAGRAGEGPYGGSTGNASRLRRGRQIYSRLSYTQHAWSAELFAFHNRRSVGTHGGVDLGPGDPLSAAFDPASPLLNDRARRRTVRTDLGLTVRARLPGAWTPPAATLYYSAETFQYFTGGGSFGQSQTELATRVNRVGARLRQRLPFGLTLRAEAWADALDGDSTAYAVPAGTLDRQLHITARDSLRLGAFEAVLEAGAHASTHGSAPSAALRLGTPPASPSRLHLFLDARYGPAPLVPVARYGFGVFAEPSDALPEGRLLHAEAGLAWQGGSLDARLSAFVHELRDAVDLFATDQADVVLIAPHPSPARRVGATLALGWRRAATQGFYLAAQGTASRLLDAEASPELERLAASLPEVYAHARLGARYAPFQGDLDFDAYLVGHAWSAFRSRPLHAPTGLLALPRPGARTLGTSGTVDLYVEVLLRGASLFVAYENLVSGTPLVDGAVVVPIYPLPERRFRFGVFWPIQG